MTTLKTITLLFLLFCTQITKAQSASACITSKFELPQLDSVANNKPMAYFIGIAEGVSVNYELLPMQIEYFVQQGIKYIVIERSYADSYLYNLFLKTGDEKYIEGDVEWSEDMRVSLRKIYKLNLSLVDEKRIEFIGIDAPNYAGSIVKTLGHLFSDRIPPVEIKPFVDSIRTLDRYPIYHFWKKIKIYNETFIGYVNKNYQSFKLSFESFLGKDYFHLVQIAENKASHFRPRDRNKDMFSNMDRIYENIHQKPSLFIFGSTHTSKQVKGSLANRTLRDHDSPFFDRVQVIGTHYENSKAFYTGKEIVINQSLLDFEFKGKKAAMIQNIKNNLNCSISIHNTGLLVELKPLNSDFDYLLLVEKGQAINSLRKNMLSK